MVYSDNAILRDVNGDPIPQYYDPVADAFKPIQGEDSQEVTLNGRNSEVLQSHSSITVDELTYVGQTVGSGSVQFVDISNYKEKMIRIENTGSEELTVWRIEFKTEVGGLITRSYGTTYTTIAAGATQTISYNKDNLEALMEPHGAMGVQLIPSNNSTTANLQFLGGVN